MLQTTHFLVLSLHRKPEIDAYAGDKEHFLLFLCQELVFWLHPKLFFWFKNDKKINSDDATNAASLSRTRSLPTFDVYNTQQTELRQYCARLISKIHPAL